MTKHVHLLLRPEQAALVPQVPISVGRQYLHEVNHTQGRTGSPWDGRYQCSLVQANT